MKKAPKALVGGFVFVCMLLLTCAIYHGLASGTMKRKAATEELSEIAYLINDHYGSGNQMEKVKNVEYKAVGMYYTNLKVSMKQDGYVELSNASKGLCSALSSFLKGIDTGECIRTRGTVLKPEQSGRFVR